MSYLNEFQLLIEGEKLANFLRLWEEYCMADQVDGEELGEILQLIKASTMASTFGQFAESILPLWQRLSNQKMVDGILKLTIDLQTSNSPLLADLAIDNLKKRFGHQPHFNEKLRIVGLLTRHSFQGAISNFELLTHMIKGNFVFHTGGWGAGEVMEMSLLREHVLLEFEGITAMKDLSFENAFNNLIPLPSDHFLARRFGNPDALEKLGREDPVALVTLLLRDLGPKTAQEIKDELSELVIPESDWSKWWQQARAKIKKDTKITSPSTAKHHFILREEGIPHEFRFKEALKKAKTVDERLQQIYNFTRDFPEVLKNVELKLQLKTYLLEGLEPDKSLPDFSLARKIQVTLLLEDFFPDEFPAASVHLIKHVEHLEGILNLIDIIAFKKRVLTIVREHREDWRTLFLHLLFLVPQNALRDYILKELQADPGSKELLKAKIHELLHRMTLYPEAFFWYFQKVSSKEDVPLNDKESCYQFLEAYLILLHFIEEKSEYRDLVKKMYQQLLAKRYALVRSMIENASVEYLKEFLLLASKCSTFSKQDLRILHDLSEVVQPSLAGQKKSKREPEEIIWTTAEGFQKIQERVQHIGTVETVENAKEIEAARSLGDLRENSEYKFALERRSRLQAELGTLSRQLNQARILTREDISLDTVGVGAIVELIDSKGRHVTYTLLGPWDADPEKHILSFQSKLAQSMMGYATGESFEFQGERFTIKKIKSFLK